MTRVIASLTLFVLPCAAQVVPLVPLPQRGMLPSFQAGIVFDHEPGIIRRKLTALDQTMSTFTAGVYSPAYDATAALQWLRNSVELPMEAPLEIDAMSSGNDLLPTSYDPISATFRIGFGNIAGWANLSLVVEDETPSANVISYYFDNPDFPTHLRNAMYHELLRADHVLPSGPLPNNAGIRALDVNMGLIQSANGRRDRTLPVVDRMYFSLTPASAAIVNAALDPSHDWFGRGAINGAAIFVARYDQVGSLTQIDLHRTASELGLPAPMDDIDALGVAFMTGPSSPVNGQHQLVGGEFFYVVSLGNGLAPTEELQVIAMTQDPTSNNPPVRRRAPLRTNTGLRLVGGNGLTPRVKALCARDPERVPGAVPTGGHAMGVPSSGLPASLPPIPTSPTQVLSLTAEGTGPGAPHDSFHIVGTLTGDAQQPPTMVALVLVAQGETFFFLSGLWNPSQGPYQFSKPLNFPWVGSPTHNVYEVVMATLDGANQPLFSHRSLLLRTQH